MTCLRYSMVMIMIRLVRYLSTTLCKMYPYLQFMQRTWLEDNRCVNVAFFVTVAIIKPVIGIAAVFTN